MRSVIYQLEAPFQLVRREEPLTEDLADTGILAETKLTAVSPGTELAAWEGKPPLRPSTVYPRLLGYCNLALVKNTGAAVERVRPGDFILTHQAHRSAFICAEKDVLLCMSDASEELLGKLTATYIYHLGYSALLAGDFRPGHCVSVVGLGTIGLTVASLLNVFGAQPLLFTNQELNRSTLKNQGFSLVFHKQEAVPPIVEKHTRGLNGSDITINTSDKWPDHLLAMRLTRKCGTIVCIGFPGRGEAAADFNPLDSQYFYDKQLTIKHCGHVAQQDHAPHDVRFTLKRNMSFLADLIRTNRINPLEILSLESPWDKLDEVYRTLASRPAGIHSALIRWS
jgi:threonine dehydrogenase-like Zn-dependent dehydrogenase